VPGTSPSRYGKADVVALCSQGNAQCRRKTPPGWNNNNYWSSTPSASGHSNVNLNNGNVNDNNDTNNNNVCLQVL